MKRVSTVRGPGHFLGEAQTLELMQRDYVCPEIGGRETPDDWLEAGAMDATDAAYAYAAAILADHYPDHVGPAVDALIRDRWNIVVSPRPGC